MKFLSTAELQATLPAVWGASNDEDTNLLRDLAGRFPGMMRRIHDIVTLTREKFGLAGWLYRSLDGALPINLLRSGEDGLRELDAVMVERLRRVAPREIFEMPGQATDVEGEGNVLLHLLWDRDGALPGQSGEIHDPMRFDRFPIRDAGRRLSAAVGRYIRSEDSETARKLLGAAISDDNPEICRSAIAASGWLVGFEDVRERLKLMSVHPERSVRIATVRALSQRSEQPEVAKLLRPFLIEKDELVRRAAIEAFVGKTLPLEVTAIIWDAVLDEDPEVARLAQLVVPEAQIIYELTHIAKKLKGEIEDSVHSGELEALAHAEGYLPDEEREHAFLVGFELVRLEDDLNLGAELVRVLAQQWRGELSLAFWTYLASRNDLMSHPEAQERMRVLVQDSGEMPAAWVFIEAYIRSAAINDDRATLMAATAAGLGKRVPHFILQLLRVAQDSALETSRRMGVITALGGVGISKAVSDGMKVLFMAEKESPRLAREALISALQAAGPDEKKALLDVARQAPIPMVRHHADAASKVMQGIGPAESEGSEATATNEDGLIDFEAARRRRKGTAKTTDKT